MAYGLDRGASDEQPMILVFDLGGGTFDVCLLQSFDGILEVVASDGDSALGGVDVDHAIALALLKRLSTGNGAYRQHVVAVVWPAHTIVCALLLSSSSRRMLVVIAFW